LVFIKQTLFPELEVYLLAIDERMEIKMKNNLQSYGINLLEIPCFNGLSEPVSAHVDMQITHIFEDIIVCQPQMPEYFYQQLKDYGFRVYKGASILNKHYPLDIPYNVAIVGDVAFHNTKYTDPVIVGLLSRLKIRLVHVNQGYTKCSVLPITNKSIITDDPSIEKAARLEGFDVLKLPPQRNIVLSGLNYGFIGGTAGFIGKNTLAFSGSIDAIDSKDEIKEFLHKYNVEWINLGDNQLHDYGGLIPLLGKI
jgi:hypothetical protein